MKHLISHRNGGVVVTKCGEYPLMRRLPYHPELLGSDANLAAMHTLHPYLYTSIMTYFVFGKTMFDTKQ